MTRLAVHFSKKVRVAHDASTAHVHFPWGELVMSATPDEIEVVATGENSDSLARVRSVLESHLDLARRRGPVTVSWRDDSDPS